MKLGILISLAASNLMVFLPSVGSAASLAKPHATKHKSISKINRTKPVTRVCGATPWVQEVRSGTGEITYIVCQGSGGGGYYPPATNRRIPGGANGEYGPIYGGGGYPAATNQRYPDSNYGPYGR